MSGAATVSRVDRSIAEAVPHVELRNVSLIYGEGEAETLAIDRVSLEVGQGEFIAVVGPSGCGKSTLMKLVTGLLPPDGGAVLVNGEVVSGPVKGVGMAFQNSTLLPWRTTRANVMLPLEVVPPHKKHLRRDRAAYEARVDRLLASVGLGGFGPKFPWELSGGMQQRASLCRALIHEPGLLMLDEPFGALDAFTREELWAILQDLWLQRRFSTVLVTHDLREAVYLSDTVYVMSKRPGRVVMARRIDLPRPRTLAGSFEAAFVDIVHELRDAVGTARA